MKIITCINLYFGTYDLVKLLLKIDGLIILIISLIICLITVDFSGCRASLSDGLEEARDDIVSVTSIQQSGAVIVNEPTRHLLSFLHILSEISLPAPVDTE